MRFFFASPHAGCVAQPQWRIHSDNIRVTPCDPIQNLIDSKDASALHIVQNTSANFEQREPRST